MVRSGRKGAVAVLILSGLLHIRITASARFPAISISLSPPGSRKPWYRMPSSSPVKMLRKEGRFLEGGWKWQD